MTYTHNPVDRPLTETEVRTARVWMVRHNLYVERLLGNAGEGYRPVGSDMIRPELWKPEHWRWFQQTHG